MALYKIHPLPPPEHRVLVPSSEGTQRASTERAEEDLPQHKEEAAQGGETPRPRSDLQSTAQVSNKQPLPTEELGKAKLTRQVSKKREARALPCRQAANSLPREAGDAQSSPSAKASK